MKQFLSIILILMLALLCFGACGLKGEPETSEEGISVTEQENSDGEKASFGETAGLPGEEDGNTAKTEQDTPTTDTDGSKQTEGGTAKTVGTSTDAAAVDHCTLSITCNTVFDNLDSLDSSKLEILPEDGVILAKRVVEFTKGETVFDVLLRETKTNKIHMEYSSNPTFNSSYIEGINNLYEFDCGELSGWTYKINGKGVGYGSSNYILSDGDVVEWVYTCDQGRDVDIGNW